MNIGSAPHTAAIAQPLPELTAQPARQPAAAAAQHGTPPSSPRHARGQGSTMERSLRSQLAARAAPAPATRSSAAARQTSAAQQVFPTVEHVLSDIPHRAGGSLAARLQYGAPREPKDIDLEFRNYDDAEQAARLLKEFGGRDTGQFPQIAYFLETDREHNVSITMAAMGIARKDERPTQLAQIELNNENTRQGDRDFKHLPQTRYGAEQPPLMRRNSLVAGVLERYSYTLAERASDDKQDKAQLQHLLRGMTDDELVSLPADIAGHFDWEVIRSAPPETVEASSSEGESGSESDSESSSVSSGGARHAFMSGPRGSVEDLSSEEESAGHPSGSESDSESSSVSSTGVRHAASAAPGSVEDSSSDEEDVRHAFGSESGSESSSVHSSGESAAPLVIHHPERMANAMNTLGELVAAEQTRRKGTQ